MSDQHQVCVYCSKECKSSDSKPFPSSKSKDRIHNRCHIRKSLADRQHQKSGASRPAATNECEAPAEPKITSSLNSPSLDLIGQLRRDDEQLRAEASAHKLEKLMADQEEQAKKARKDASFFFDIKAGIAKPHEKRQFLHHRNICEIAPRFNDHGYQEEALGRAYDHSGKDLNTLGDPSDNEDGEDESRDDRAKKPERRRQVAPHLSAKGESTISKRKLDADGHQENPRKARRGTVGVKVDESNPCWFCLSSPKVEKHLILAIGDYCYLTLAKGGLTDQHFLLIPIEHIQSVHDPANSPELLKELDDFKRSLVDYFKHQSLGVVFFERNFRSVHWQLQVVPVAESLITAGDQGDDSGTLADKIKAISKQHFGNSNYLDIPSKQVSIGDMVPPSAPYLYWQVEPLGQRFVCQIELKNSFFPVQLARIVLADKQIMDCPERVDWKRCAKSQEEYVELVARLKKAYQDYDITC